jgi:hypothetical protein
MSFENGIAGFTIAFVAVDDGRGSDDNPFQRLKGYNQEDKPWCRNINWIQSI